jgi:hypothetical protein
LNEEAGQKFLSDCEKGIMLIINKRGKTKTSKIISLLNGLYSVDQMLESLDSLKERGLID